MTALMGLVDLLETLDNKGVARQTLVARNGEHCSLGRHRPRARLLHWHHLWPLYLGGPAKGEKVLLCPNCHANVHLIISALELTPVSLVLPDEFAALFTEGQLRLARLGIVLALNAQA